MKRYLRSRLVRAGVVLLLLGTGPLVGFITYAKLGFYHDPNPNPVYLGILAWLTFWPSVFLIGFGMLRASRTAHSEPLSADKV